MSRSCPPNSFVFNSTLCHCKPGYLLEASKNSCELFNVSRGEWAVSYGVDYRPIFFETLFSFDTIRKFTQSQAVFLEATLVAILSWLLFCAAVRFGRLDEGRSVWFQIRWWISRWDFCFATRHWLVLLLLPSKFYLDSLFLFMYLFFFVGSFVCSLWIICALWLSAVFASFFFFSFSFISFWWIISVEPIWVLLKTSLETGKWFLFIIYYHFILFVF